jgi:hypothetical protein
MAIPRLANDFREFLKLLNWNGVEYLPIGGYAVGAHGYIRGLHPGVTSGGYVRATNDLDIRVRRVQVNAGAVERACGWRFLHGVGRGV